MAIVAEHATTPAVLLLSGDTRGLTTQLLTTMSLCTPHDAAAVEAFLELLKVEPEAVDVILKVFISTPSREDDRRTAAAARILCGLLVPNWVFFSLWTQLADEVKDQVRSVFVSALQSDPSDIVLKLATVLGAWHHILPCLLRAASSVGPVAFADQKMVLLILARIPPVEDLSDSLATIRDVLRTHLNHSTADLRINSLAAAANLIKILVTNVDKMRILSLLPLMAKPLQDCLDSDLSFSAQEALQLLVELASTAPSILRPNMASVESEISAIALAKCLPIETRRLAAFFLTSVAKSAGVGIKAELAMQKRSDMTDFVCRITLLLLNMLAEIDNEVVLPMEQDEESMTRVAQNCLHGLANAIGGTTLIPVAMHWLRSSAGSDWKQSYANLVAITQLAEGCANVMMKHIAAIITILSSGLEQSHPVVHWVTIDAIAAIYAYLGLEMSYLTTVLLSLMRFMSTSCHDPHLKKHASQTLYEIVQKSEPAMIEPILGELLNCLHLSRGKAEEAPPVVAPLASSSAVTTHQSLPPAGHETILVHLPQGIDHNDQTRAEVGATPATGNQQQADEPVSKEALIDFLKAFSNGGVMSTTSLTILVGYQVSVKDFPDPWKFGLKSCLFMGITFALATAGVAHSVEHHNGWLEAASTMVLFEGFYTIILGGGLVGLAHTNEAITSVVCALTMFVFAFGWSCFFSHPRWVKIPKGWRLYQAEDRADLFESIGEVWQRIKGQDNRAPEPRGGWFSKFRQV